MRTILAVSVFLAASLAHAQVQPAPAARRVVIDMDADVIEGVRLQPPAHVVGSKGDTKHKSLIQLRKDFRREVLASGSHL